LFCALPATSSDACHGGLFDELVADPAVVSAAVIAPVPARACSGKDSIGVAGGGAASVPSARGALRLAIYPRGRDLGTDGAVRTVAARHEALVVGAPLPKLTRSAK